MSIVKKGSCLCGKIKFECIGNPISFSLCHCTMCQKFSGGPFGAFVGYKKNNFKITEGKNSEKLYKSSQWASRSFCSNCGASVSYLFIQMEDSVFLGAGLFDDPLYNKPTRHIFVKDKCDWFEITDNIPQIEQY